MNAGQRFRFIFTSSIALTLLGALVACGGSTEAAEGSTEQDSTAAVLSPDTTFVLDASALDNHDQPFVRNNDHLAMNVRFAPVRGVQGALNEKLGTTLKQRGEAHVTVLTPPEFSILSRSITIADVNRLALAGDIEASDLKAVCLGSGTARGNKKLQTYFIVVTSQRLFQLRRDVKALFVSRGGKASAFDAEAFTPHVTVGFTQRDLFEADGVVKDQTSCVAQLDVR